MAALKDAGADIRHAGRRVETAVAPSNHSARFVDTKSRKLFADALGSDLQFSPDSSEKFEIRAVHSPTSRSRDRCRVLHVELILALQFDKARRLV